MFDKQEDKGVRQPITENPLQHGKETRRRLNKGMKLDVSRYEELHRDKKLMLISDYGTDVQWWLDNGAQPVPLATDPKKVYKGINDKQESEWVSFVGGKDGSGNQYRMYLLMIDPSLYEQFKLAPERERQEEIEKAMRIGANASDIAGHLPGGGGMQTYAPNLPTGSGQGYGEINPIR